MGKNPILNYHSFSSNFHLELSNHAKRRRCQTTSPALLLALSSLACGLNLDFDLQIWSLLAAKHGQSPSVVANTGAKVGFWRGDIKGLVDDIGALKPTIFIGVPRVFDRIYSGVLAKIQVGVAGALASDCYCECAVSSEQAGHQKYMPSRVATDSSWPVRCPCAVVTGSLAGQTSGSVCQGAGSTVEMLRWCYAGSGRPEEVPVRLGLQAQAALH